MLVRLVRRRPLLSFAILAYALSWSWWLLYILVGFPFPILACGPFLTALVTTALVEGRAEVRALLARLVRWRVAPRWYAAAVGQPLALHLAATRLNLLLGAAADADRQLRQPYLIVPMLLFNLLFPLGGAFGEELGWRGHALPRVRARYGALAASLLIGALQAAWHLPLFAAGVLHAADLPVFFGLGVAATWLFGRTGGSVLHTMLLHAAFNTGAAFFGSIFVGNDFARLTWLLGGLWCLAAIVISPALARRRARHDADDRGCAHTRHRGVMTPRRHRACITPIPVRRRCREGQPCSVPVGRRGGWAARRGVGLVGLWLHRDDVKE